MGRASGSYFQAASSLLYVTYYTTGLERLIELAPVAFTWLAVTAVSRWLRRRRRHSACGMLDHVSVRCFLGSQCAHVMDRVLILVPANAAFRPSCSLSGNSSVDSLAAVASLGRVTPGAATEGVTLLFFPEKPGDLFLLIAVTITIAFYCFHSGVTPSRVGCHLFTCPTSFLHYSL